MSISLVSGQTTTGTYTSQTTYVLAYPGNNTAGNLLFCSVNAYTFASSITSGSIADSQGNTWVLLEYAVDPVSPFNASTATFYCLNCKGGANTITFSGVATPFNGGDMIITEVNVSGGGLWALDKNGQGDTSGAATTWTSNAITTTVANEILLGCIASRYGSLTLNTPFNTLGTNESNFLAYYEIVTSIQTGVSAGGGCASNAGNGQSWSLSSFYVVTPTVSSCSPAAGPETGGGETVTITGTGFASGATVQFGGNSATNVTVVSSTSITCTPPPSTIGIGAVNVTVTTGGGTGTGTNAFTYAYIAYVGGATAHTTTSPLTITYTPTPGNFIFIATDNFAYVTSCVDNNGNPLTAGVPTNGQAIYANGGYFYGYAQAGATSYTLTYSNIGTPPFVACLAEYAGSNRVLPGTQYIGAVGGGTGTTVSIAPTSSEPYSFIVASLVTVSSSGATSQTANTGNLRQEVSAGSAPGDSCAVVDNTSGATVGSTVTDSTTSSSNTGWYATAIEIFASYVSDNGALCLGHCGNT